VELSDPPFIQLFKLPPSELPPLLLRLDLPPLLLPLPFSVELPPLDLPIFPPQHFPLPAELPDPIIRTDEGAILQGESY
jgi:hypothetical protein